MMDILDEVRLLLDGPAPQVVAPRDRTLLWAPALPAPVYLKRQILRSVWQWYTAEEYRVVLKAALDRAVASGDAMIAPWSPNEPLDVVCIVTLPAAVLRDVPVLAVWSRIAEALRINNRLVAGLNLIRAVDDEAAVALNITRPEMQS